LIAMFEGAENKNSLYVADLRRRDVPDIKAPIVPVMATNDAEYWPIGNRGTTLFLRTDKDAPNRKIIGVDLRNPAPSAWKTVVAERREAIENVAVIGGRIVTQYLVDVQSRLLLFGL